MCPWVTFSFLLVPLLQMLLVHVWSKLSVKCLLVGIHARKDPISFLYNTKTNLNKKYVHVFQFFAKHRHCRKNLNAFLLWICAKNIQRSRSSCKRGVNAKIERIFWYFQLLPPIQGNDYILDPCTVDIQKRYNMKIKVTMKENRVRYKQDIKHNDLFLLTIISTSSNC